MTSDLKHFVKLFSSLPRHGNNMLIARYGILGTFRLLINWVLTRLLYPSARIVRFPIYLRGKKYMFLGDSLTTGVNVRLDAVKHPGRKIVLYIGCNVQLNDSVHIAAIEEVVIGDFTLIASRVFISDHNHGSYAIQDPLSIPSIPPVLRPLSSSPVYIGKNVWLGEQVCVLPGVTIGDGSIIGANSVVTHDIPPNSIAVGNPARVLKIFDKFTNSWVRV